MGPIPDRWENYKPIGKKIEGTRFIAFKVPLKKHVSNKVQQEIQLDIGILLKTIPNLGMVIDLTNTYRYYDPTVFQAKGIIHKKLMIPGHHTPHKKLVDEFTMMVNNFLDSNKDNDKLIGVHCTHGVNRTGYMICYYMISQMAMEPNEAITKFFNARGHQIERINYVNSLKNLRERTNQNSNNNEEARPEYWKRRKIDVVQLENWRQQRPSSPPTARCSRKKRHNEFFYRSTTDQIAEKAQSTVMSRTYVVQVENWRQRKQNQHKNNDGQFAKRPSSSDRIRQWSRKLHNANVRPVSPSPTPPCSRQNRHDACSSRKPTDQISQTTFMPKVSPKEQPRSRTQIPYRVPQLKLDYYNSRPASKSRSSIQLKGRPHEHDV